MKYLYAMLNTGGVTFLAGGIVYQNVGLCAFGGVVLGLASSIIWDHAKSIKSGG